MKLDVRALTIGMGILWALIVLFVAIVNLVSSGYGEGFLQAMASIYPGYDATPSIGDVIVGVLYALIDGAICGWILAWLYNRFLRKAMKT